MIKLLGLVAYAGLSAFWLCRTGEFPRFPLGDAWSYAFLAEKIRSHGILPDLGDVRTYAYPHFIAAASLLVGTGKPVLALGVGIVQALFFAAAVWWLSQKLAGRPSWSLAVLAGLLLNPLLIDLITDILTEGPTVIIAVLLGGVIIQSVNGAPHRWLAWLVLGSALSTLAFVIRPANISFVIGWNLAALYITVRGASGRHSAPRRLCIYASLAAVVSAALLAPQLYHNVKYYSKLTVFPVMNLGEFQVAFGIRLWKYGTIAYDLMARPLNYVNPTFVNWPAYGPIPYSWYAENPGAGLLTLVVHLFNAFNYDYPTVYIYDINFPSPLLAALVWCVQAIGAVELARLIRAFIKDGWRKPDVAALLLLYGVICAQTIAILAISAVENRFAAIPTALLFVLACHAGLHLRSWSKRRLIITIWAVCGASSVGVLGTMYMKSIMTTVPLS